MSLNQHIARRNARKGSKIKKTNGRYAARRAARKALAANGGRI